MEHDTDMRRIEDLKIMKHTVGKDRDGDLIYFLLFSFFAKPRDTIICYTQCIYD